MTTEIKNRTKREIEGKPYIYYDGYWIKRYEPPADNLAAKKRLIEALTRRLFNHMEHGINVPGSRLDEARRSYEEESDDERRRVKSAMLAGALFNRATDIFTKAVELQALGIEIKSDNALIRECGKCLLEALELGKSVRHRNGDASIDELWGEPFKAFTLPIPDFYESRYIKIAQTMREIDRIATTMTQCFAHSRFFTGIEERITGFAEAAKRKCETLRTDPDIFNIWTDFVVAGEHLVGRDTGFPPQSSEKDIREIRDGRQLITNGKNLSSYIVRARVPMPESTQAYVDSCHHYLSTYFSPAAVAE